MNSAANKLLCFRLKLLFLVLALSLIAPGFLFAAALPQLSAKRPLGIFGANVCISKLALGKEFPAERCIYSPDRADNQQWT